VYARVCIQVLIAAEQKERQRRRGVRTVGMEMTKKKAGNNEGTDMFALIQKETVEKTER
jgi:hypothetical protein